jgi:hypothetical protein
MNSINMNKYLILMKLIFLDFLWKNGLFWKLSGLNNSSSLFISSSLLYSPDSIYSSTTDCLEKDLMQNLH